MHIARPKAAANMLLPPIVPKALERLRRSVRRSPKGSLRFDFRPEWALAPEGWSTSVGSNGWLDPSIVDTQRQRWATYSDLITGTGPLGFHLFTSGSITTSDESAHNVFMTFAYVVARAALRRRELSILDWGGGIGYYALIAQRLLPEVALDYVIKELPGLADLGRELMPMVRFECEELRCFSRSYDLVLASSSIQYSQNWRALLTQLATAANEWLYIARVPIVRRAKSFVVVQRPYHYGYRTEYFSWVLNKDELLAHIGNQRLTLEREVLAGRTSRLRGAPESIENLGFLFRKQKTVDEDASLSAGPVGQTQRLR
ncbi:MAG TPA: hypothetical protein VGU20_30095 [Stellaceae bacterium]|nr:hypothetical protein [Stellaceae bacterium]